MSLIQEALEKAAKHRGESSHVVTDITPSFEEVLKSIQATEKRPELRRPADYKKIILPAAVISFLLAAAALFLVFGKKPGTAPLMMSGVSSISQIPQAPVINAPKFVLTGITISNGQRLALINNQVVGTGDRLKEKAFIKQIGEDFAVLDLSGREIKLSL